MSGQTNNLKPNRLKEALSPYLLQHAYNPVDWYEWGPKAFEKAKREDKMLLISIGYAACHWCHVMAHQCFEDEAVALIMNDNFVCVKVDREERPDVDHVYMNAVQLLTQSGGWPLNCFALPDGSPVFGGTYFPKENWKQVLMYLANIYKNEREKVVEQATLLKEGIVQSDTIRFSETPKTFSEKDLQTIFEKLSQNFDTNNGGLKGSPKFPMPGIWNFLLRLQHYSKNKEALDNTLLTLDKMARSGIYDQLGGGFARYSTDELWFAPHFEKMLYDNAQLICLYCEAYQISGNDFFKQIAGETIGFLERELMSPDGAFYSSLDADSEGVEGKYYTWSTHEIRDALKEEYEVFVELYNLRAEGNWEHNRNILHEFRTPKQVAETLNLKIEEVDSLLKTGKKKLFKARNNRIRPGLDDKIITAWNALTIKSLADAARILNNEHYRQMAIRGAEFIVQNQLNNDFSLYRMHKDSQTTTPAFLDDYAHCIEAFIALYRLTFDEKWLLISKQLMDYVFQYFSDTETPIFYYTNKAHHDLVIRKMEISDNVIPSSNSVMANNLFLLGKYFADENYLNRSRAMLSQLSESIIAHPAYFSNWVVSILNHLYNNFEIAIIGTHMHEKVREIEDKFLPDLIIAGSLSPSSLPLLEGRFQDMKTLIYACRNNSCQLPVERVDEMFQQLQVH